MTTDRTNPPNQRPELYRSATREDVLNPQVLGFYAGNGEYWRKNGKVKTWKTRPNDFRVPVKFGLRDFGQVDQDNLKYCYVKL